MTSKTNPADLAECVEPLDQEGQRAVRRYWDQVVREATAGPVVRPIGYPVPFVDDIRRERREARRALARVVSAGRPRLIATHTASVEVAA